MQESCRKMSLKIKTVVGFLKHTTCLLLSRPFGNALNIVKDEI